MVDSDPTSYVPSSIAPTVVDPTANAAPGGLTPINNIPNGIQISDTINMNGPDAQAASNKALSSAISGAGTGVNNSIQSALKEDNSAFNTIFGHTATAPTPQVSSPIAGTKALGQSIQVGNPGDIAATPMVPSPQIPQTSMVSDRRAKYNIKSANEQTISFLNQIYLQGNR